MGNRWLETSDWKERLREGGREGGREASNVGKNERRLRRWKWGRRRRRSEEGGNRHDRFRKQLYRILRK